MSLQQRDHIKLLNTFFKKLGIQIPFHEIEFS